MLAIFQDVRVVAAILEGTLSFARVEMLARNFLECFFVLLEKSIFVRSTVDSVKAWNDKI